MILTEDGHFVTPDHPVFEIRYRWYNAETSHAEPQRIAAGNAQGKIWLYEFPCSMECLGLNKFNQDFLIVESTNAVKMINETICQ